MNKTAVLFIVLGVMTAAALMVLLKPRDSATPALPDAVTPAQLTPPPAGALKPLVPTYEWQIAGGKRVSGPETVQVHQGEMLTLRFTSDQADELHLHGYDMQVQLKPGEQASISLQADHSGRFELELHHAHLDLAVLEVLPGQ